MHARSYRGISRRPLAQIGREAPEPADTAAQVHRRSLLFAVAYSAERWDRVAAMGDSILALDPGNFRALWRLASVASRQGERRDIAQAAEPGSMRKARRGELAVNRERLGDLPCSAITARFTASTSEKSWS